MRVRAVAVGETFALAPANSRPFALALALFGPSVQPGCSASARVVIQEALLLLTAAAAACLLGDAVGALRQLAAHPARQGKG